MPQMGPLPWVLVLFMVFISLYILASSVYFWGGKEFNPIIKQNEKASWKWF